ncbi:MAG: KH domain-containing protein [Desulfobacterales bacterium]
MKDLITEIVQAIVDQPDHILVTGIEGDHTNVLELSVAKSDMGKVIGRKGRTAQAIRVQINHFEALLQDFEGLNYSLC